MDRHQKHPGHTESASAHSTDDASLHESYGQPIPEPKMVKGKFVNFGILAGHGDVEGERDTWFRDSINDNKKNQPKSH